MLNRTNLLGALVATGLYLSATLVFVLRLLGRPHYARRVGSIELLLALPLAYLLLTARQLNRPALYTVQVGLMLAWLLVELLLDYILRAEFRSVRWMVIGYVVLFFAGAGGCSVWLPVLDKVGRPWRPSYSSSWPRWHSSSARSRACRPAGLGPGPRPRAASRLNQRPKGVSLVCGLTSSQAAERSYG
jgi:hypothetical protein